jgi:hypothetical protein
MDKVQKTAFTDQWVCVRSNYNIYLYIPFISHETSPGQGLMFIFFYIL